MCVCVYLHVCVYLCICMCVCVCVCVCTCVHTLVCTCMCIYMCMCILCVYAFTALKSYMYMIHKSACYGNPPLGSCKHLLLHVELAKSKPTCAASCKEQKHNTHTSYYNMSLHSNQA